MQRGIPIVSCDVMQFLQCSLEQGNKRLGFSYPTWVDYGEGGSFSLQKMSFVGVDLIFSQSFQDMYTLNMSTHVICSN